MPLLATLVVGIQEDLADTKLQNGLILEKLERLLEASKAQSQLTGPAAAPCDFQTSVLFHEFKANASRLLVANLLLAGADSATIFTTIANDPQIMKLSSVSQKSEMLANIGSDGIKALESVLCTRYQEVVGLVCASLFGDAAPSRLAKRTNRLMRTLTRPFFDDRPKHKNVEDFKAWQEQTPQRIFAQALTLIDVTIVDDATEASPDHDHAAQKANLVTAVQLAVMVLSWLVKIVNKEFENLSDADIRQRAVAHVGVAVWETQHQEHVDHLERMNITAASVVWMLHFLSSYLGCYKHGDFRCVFGRKGSTDQHTEHGIREWAIDVVLGGTDTDPAHYQSDATASFESLVKVPGLSMDQRSKTAQALVAISQINPRDTPTKRRPDLTVNGVCGVSKPESCFASLLEFA